MIPKIPTHIGLGSLLGGGAGALASKDDNPLRGALIGALVGGALGGLKGAFVNKALTSKLTPSLLDEQIMFGGIPMPRSPDKLFGPEFSLMGKARLSMTPAEDFNKGLLELQTQIDHVLSQYADKAIMKNFSNMAPKELLYGRVAPAALAGLSPFAATGGYHAAQEFDKRSSDQVFELGRLSAEKFLA